MNKRDLTIAIVGSILGLLSSAIGGIAVGKYMLSENQSVVASKELRDTVSSMRRLVDRIEVKVNSLDDVVTRTQMRSALEVYRYRLETTEKTQETNIGRISNLAETQRRLCRALDVTCAARNALWHPPGRYLGNVTWRLALLQTRRDPALIPVRLPAPS